MKITNTQQYQRLWGVATLQFYLYLNVNSSSSSSSSSLPCSLLVPTQSFLKDFSKKDSRWLKIFVAFIYCLDTAHQAMLVQFIYVYLVTEFGNLSFLLKIDRFVHNVQSFLRKKTYSQNLQLRNPENLTVISALLEAMVQALYVLRVWRCKFPASHIGSLRFTHRIDSEWQQDYHWDPFCDDRCTIRYYNDLLWRNYIFYISLSARFQG